MQISADRNQEELHQTRGSNYINCDDDDDDDNDDETLATMMMMMMMMMMTMMMNVNLWST